MNGERGWYGLEREKASRLGTRCDLKIMLDLESKKGVGVLA